MKLRALLRGILRDICNLFQPWQDMNAVRSQVKETRAKVPRLPWRVGTEWTWRYTIWPGETRDKWSERMNSNAAYLARRLERAERGENVYKPAND